MKTKILLFYLFFFWINSILSKEYKFSGKIMDHLTKEPVFGATIFYHGKPLCFSDESGSFQLILDDPPGMDSLISISHLAYQEKSMPLSSIKIDIPIYLEEKIYPIDEVRIRPFKAKNVLKQIKEKYRSGVPSLSHWADAHYSQLIQYRGIPRSYLECYGNMLIMGAKENSPFNGSYCVPSELRRTREDPLLLKIVLPNGDRAGRLQASGIYVSHALNEYHFFQFCHPLKSKLSGKFTFQLDSIVEYQNESCFLFSYKQKGIIQWGGNHLRGMQGQIWASVNDFNLKKITSIFNRGDLYTNQLIEEDTLSDNKLYPKNLSLKVINNCYLNQTLPQKIYIETKIDISNIDPGEYYAANFGYMIESYLPSLRYDKDFWNKHPIRDDYLQSKVSELLKGNVMDAEFEKGSREKVFQDHKYFDAVSKKWSDKTLEFLRNDFLKTRER